MCIKSILDIAGVFTLITGKEILTGIGTSEQCLQSFVLISQWKTSVSSPDVRIQGVSHFARVITIFTRKFKVGLGPFMFPVFVCCQSVPFITGIFTLITFIWFHIVVDSLVPYKTSCSLTLICLMGVHIFLNQYVC